MAPNPLHNPQDRPPPTDAATLAPVEAPQSSPADPADLLDCFGESTGTVIGRYKLLQPIGEGGFGTVYLAEQQHPVTRRVALKIIKLGMDTRQVIARFEAERQALAMMDHPNIARVLDAGATDTGRPYFVMELVKGVPITQYCDRNSLTLRQRIELLIPVCQSIQHAHQKGIIHRDLKPSNVLISVHDGKPVPKVIDFGIAKAVNQRLTEQTLFTEYNQMIGTPEYMSPEQAEMSGLDIDTRTDLYALGVLMYELLTGSTPFDSRQLRSGTYADIQRIIREVDPPRPSTRLSMLESLPSVAAQRRADPRRLAQLVRGELDWIVMKCLEKDRTRRYESADALGADLARYLGDQPVLAGPPSTVYRLRKLVRRNRTAVAVTAVVAIVLVTASIISTAQAIRATRAEARAQAQAIRADREAQNARAEADKQTAVTRFFNEMLASANPRLLALPNGTRREITVLRALHDAGLELDAGRLADQPAIEAAVRTTLGQTLQSLGEFDAAERHLRRALELNRRLHGTDAHLDVAADINALAVLLRAQGRTADAEPLLRQALALRRELLDANHPDLATSLNNLGSLLWSQGDAADAEALYNEALTIRRAALPEDHPDIPATLNNLASVLHEQGKLTEAEPLYREALSLQQRIFGEDHVDVANTLANLAALLRSAGRLGDAEPLLRRAMEIRRRHLPPEHPDLAMGASALALLLATQGNFAEAEQLYRQSLPSLRKQLVEHPDVATAMNNFATLLWTQGRHAEAEPLYRDALRIQRKILGATHPDVATSLNNLGSVLHAQGKIADAEASYREALSIRRQRRGPPHPDIATLLNNLGALAEAQEKLDEAETHYRDALRMQRELYGEHHPDIGTSLNNLAGVLELRGKLADAEALYRQAIDVDRKLGRTDHPHLAGGLSNLALMLLEQDRVDEAEPLVREALAIRQRALPEGHWHRASSAIMLGQILLRQNKPDEAEPLLLAGYEALKTDPAAPPTRRRAAVEALLALAQARDDAEQTQAWQAALQEFDAPR